MRDSGLDKFLFHQGTNFTSYEFLGCFSERLSEVYVYTFRTWAPNAVSVGLLSDFSGWDTELPFTRLEDSGVWELRYESSVSLEKQAIRMRDFRADRTMERP